MTLKKATSTSADGQFQIVGLAPTDLVNGYASEYGNSSGKGVVEVTSGTKFPSLTAVLQHYEMTMPTLRRALVSGKPIGKGRYTGLQFVYAPATNDTFPGQPGEQTARADDMQTAP